MKTDFSKLPREEIEARITTMLLGEMPADEAAELMEFVSGDSELLKLHDELKRTISLVEEASGASEAMTLSEGKREQLLASFKMVKPPELAEKPEARIDWRNWAAMAAMVGLLLGGAAFVFNSLGRYETSRTIAVNLPAGGRSDDTRFEELRERSQVEELEARRAPQKLASKAPARLMADSALEKAKPEMVAEMTERVDKALKSPSTKIELPAAEVDSLAKGKNENWGFQGGQARGFGGAPGAGGFADERFDQKADFGRMSSDDFAKRGFGEADAEKSKEVLAGGLVAGKDDALNYRDSFGVNPAEPAVAANGAVRGRVSGNDGFFDTAGATEGKTRGGVAIDALTGATTSRSASSAMNPLTGLPVASSGIAAQPIDPLAETPATLSAANQPAGPADAVSQSGAMGGMGGGASTSMMYYMQNPELMKRYFPQMYSMMQKQKAGGAAANPNGAASGMAGMPGMPGLATSDSDHDSLGRKSEDKPAQTAPPMAMPLPQFVPGAYDRYRMASRNADAKKPAASAPAPQKQVALGTELKLLKEERETVAKKSELSARPDDSAASEAVRRSPDMIAQRGEQVTAGRVLTDAEKATIAENLAKKPAETVVSRTDEFASERIAASTEIQDARSLIELGRTDEAEKKLQEVLKTDPEHRTAAAYYLDLVKDQKYSQEAHKREIAAKDSLSKVEQSWQEPIGRELLPAPNPVPAQPRKIQAGTEATQVTLGDRPASGTLFKGVASGQQARELDRDAGPQRPKVPAATPQPEVLTAENAFSTFSLNVSDVSFKLAAASLEKGLMPEAATVRSEEFINAFDYRDPEPQGAPIGFVWERARYPFAQGSDLFRFSVKTAASGRQAGKPLNLVLLLDNSGSMERADRVRILNECLKTLAAQLRPEDRISVVAFARTARLWVDGLPGNQANELPQRVGNLNPEGGTNLEEAMKVAYDTARKHFAAGGVNRVVLLTDGAANLGDVEPESLKRKVETERKKGIALDCFGIGWEGLNDELLEALSHNGDGRYGFVNTTEAAASEFAGQLAGALQVAASDVKVQVEWNPKRVTAYRQIGYAKHQLTKEQFRDNTVDAAEIGAAEAGNALYTVQVNPAGEGPLGTVRVRFKVPGTNDYREHAWPLNYEGAPKPLENSTYALRLAGTASAFSEWLVSSPYATEVTTDRLLSILSGVPEHFDPDPRPKKLEWMIRQAKSLAGK